MSPPLPRTAYVSLWFPKPTETFVFREADGLRRLGLPLIVYSLYGLKRGRFAEFMQSSAVRIERFGLRAALKILAAAVRGYRHHEGKALFGPLVGDTRAGIERYGENLWAYLCAFHLADRLVHDHIEHVHACWASGPATAACLAARLAGLPFSFTARARDLHLADNTLAFKAREAAFIRSNTHSGLATLSGMVDQTEKIHCVYNGLELRNAVPASVSMTPPYRLLAIGRLVAKKGFADLLHACRRLSERQVAVELTLVGEGPMRASLLRLAAELELDHLVRFVGFRPFEEVTSLFQCADILVAPSVIDAKGDRDGIPNVILEALWHRVPVVATDVAGIGEVIRDGETGLLVPPENPDALANAVENLTADRNRAIELAAQGRQRVTQQFSATENQSRIIELLTRYT